MLPPYRRPIPADDAVQINLDRLEYYLRVYQTSSASYVLLTSVEQSVRLLEEKRETLFDAYEERLADLIRFTEGLKDLAIVTRPVRRSETNCGESGENGPARYGDNSPIYDFDCGKIVLYSRTQALTGRDIYDALRLKYRLQPEMACGSYCLLMTSYMDTDEGFARLKYALRGLEEDILSRNAVDKAVPKSAVIPGQQRNTVACTIGEALDRDSQVMRIPMPGAWEEKKETYIAAETVDLYPPGIPFLVPGEVLQEETLSQIAKLAVLGYEFHGMEVCSDSVRMRVLNK